MSTSAPHSRSSAPEPEPQLDPDSERVPGFEPVAEPLPDIVTHVPALVADQHRPVQPGTNEQRYEFAINRLTFQRCTFLAVALGLIGFFAMLINHFQLSKANPVDNARIHLLEDQLRETRTAIEDTADADMRAELQVRADQLTTEIRELDLALRTRYFTLGQKKRFGTWGLFILIVVYVVLARLYLQYAPSTPAPIPTSRAEEEDQREAGLGRLAVCGLLLLLAGAGLGFRRVADAPPPGTAYAQLQAEIAATPDAGPQLPPPRTPEEFAANWPQFRGAALAIPTVDALPTTWDVAAGTNVAWKSAIDLPGSSSPVCWGDRVFITGADADFRELYCFDLASGQQLWSVSPKEYRKKPIEVFEEYVHASATPATDGHHVFALFGNGDLVATDIAGAVLWEKNLGSPENAWGHSSSLVVTSDVLIVQWDHTGSKSGIFAYQVHTGELVWSIDRSDYGSSWASPYLLPSADGHVLLTCVDPELAAYEPRTGKLLWKADVIGGGDVAPSPGVAGDFILTTSDTAAVTAVKPGGAGDVTATHVVWKNEDIVKSGIASPVGNSELAWIISADGGYISCVEAATGAIVYEHELEWDLWATPIVFADRLLLLGTEGECAWIGVGRTFELLGEARLEHGTMAVPALHQQSLIMRDGDNLVRLMVAEGSP
jgi:outer membrane protein assembly factor BamB